ncbi:MAG: tetratricopeptide repeat protein, partial [Eudoraea sp.]|nr:tetratricopeptide repeat protein [Eudoraea sp.]
MFTDIVGYTTLMSKDESMALQTLDENRYIHKTIISKYGGELIKEMGDGIMAIFNTATDGVYAACEIHAAAENNKDLNLRIGLHWSNIIIEKGDIFGGGVNIAARIEPTAPTCGTHISHETYSNLFNKKGLKIEFVGDFELRNLSTPLKLYSVEANAQFIKDLSKRTSDYKERSILEAKDSIAVIPFANMTGDAEQDYFGEGIADEILITLSNIKELKVVGRSSSFQFKNSEYSETQIAGTLNVNHILQGSMRRMGKRIRINAMLYSVGEESQIWAERYDRELDDIFEIQDDIADKISKELKVTLLKNVNRVKPVSLEAYELLLKGRYFEEMFIEGFDRAIACYSKAIELEPDYAEAYTALAHINFLSTMHLILPPREGFEKTKLYANKALTINSEIAGAHFVLGQVAFWFDWDFDKARENYENAAKATVPYYFTGVTEDPWYNAFADGDYETAIINTMKIIETDPLSFFNQVLLGYYTTWGQYHDKAREVLNNLLKMVPNYSEAQRLLAYNSFIEGDSERAVKEAKKAVEMAQGLGWAQITYSIALAQNGQEAEAREILKR